MFAVPGWSVAADALKTQRPSVSIETPSSIKPKDRGGAIEKSKKRKRNRPESKVPAVTSENVADLWRKHIEGKNSGGIDEGESAKKNDRRKRKRKNNGDENGTKTMNAIGDKTTTSVKPNLENDDAGDISLKDDNEKAQEYESLPQSTNQEEIPLQPSKSKRRNTESKSEGKAKYEQRQIQSSKKHEQKVKSSRASEITSPPHPAPSTEKVTVSDFRIKKPSTILNAPKHTISRTHPSPPLPPLPPKNNLTPLQTLMREKLTSARFRHLNQTLYTTPSVQSLKLFTESPSSFASYHAGFRAQVAIWPQNPINTFIADLQARATIKPPPSQKQKWRAERKGKKPAAPLSPTTPPLDPLPRSPSSNQCTIADLGCGDATLAATLTPLASKTSLRILSFDLAAGDGPHAALITIADLCHLPLRTGEVDIAILCLALMSTNWVEGVEEAARVVRLGGEVWVAEVRSRFARVKGPRGKIGGKKRDGEEGNEDDDDAALLTDEDVEFDINTHTAPASHRIPKNKKHNPDDNDTDVSPFVKVFNRRGFVLSGDPDLGNRMFVRMRFVREGGGGIREGGGGIRGVGVGRAGMGRGGLGRGGMGMGTGKEKKGKRKFIEDGDMDKDGIGDEGKVLKPCVYKTR